VGARRGVSRISAGDPDQNETGVPSPTCAEQGQVTFASATANAHSLPLLSEYRRSPAETSLYFPAQCSTLSKQIEVAMRDFAGKTAVITGAASGIGRAIAEYCVRLGVNVVLADLDESALTATADELRGAGGTVLAVPTDVSQRSRVESLARQAFDTFGQVHLLFNNAGVAAGGAPWEASWNDWEWVIGVNLWGVLHGVKVFTPLLLEQKTECHIVNTASAAGLMLGGFSAPYSVTKHAVVALSESLYLILRQRNAPVNVSVLCPGMVHTNIGDVERHRPAALANPPAPLSPEMQAGRAAFHALMAAAMPPSRVADMVFDAIRQEQFYILTHPDWTELIRLRTDRLLAMENPEDPGPTLARILNLRP
jgi:NAD(P)-dependent dehydrogenase (short-subunit alcohol dehydrogenase family)